MTEPPRNGSRAPDLEDDEAEEVEIEGALPVDEIDPSDTKHVNVANVRALLARAKKAANGNFKASKLAVDTTRGLADTGRLLQTLRFRKPALSDTAKFRLEEKIG